MTAQEKIPKVFISYSSTQSRFALRLATDLRNNGVDCVFDQWDAKSGDDLYFFMEKSVNDPSVDFVLVLCDKSYMEKANSRDGSGVSTETIIMSPKVYKTREESRYIPIACEFDQQGIAYLPTFMNIRKYISFNSNDRTFEESMMELLRRIFNEPLSPKPPLGKRPNFAEIQSLPFVQELDNIASDIEHISISNTIHARTLFTQQFTDKFIATFDNWDTSLKLTGTTETSEQIKRLLPTVQTYLKTYSTIAPEANDGEILTVESTLRWLREKYCPGHSLNNPDAFVGIRYLVFIGIGGVLLKNHQYSVLNELLQIVYSNGYGKKSYDAFYPEELVRTKNVDISELANSLGDRYIEPMVQFDLLLYYLKSEQHSPRRWWYPLLHSLTRSSHFSFPMLSSLANEKPSQEILSIFDATTKEEAIDFLNQVQPIMNGIFDTVPLPKQFYSSEF